MHYSNNAVIIMLKDEIFFPSNFQREAHLHAELLELVLESFLKKDKLKRTNRETRVSKPIAAGKGDY